VKVGLDTPICQFPLHITLTLQDKCVKTIRGVGVIFREGVVDKQRQAILASKANRHV
jgi:hypothetical protein